MLYGELITLAKNLGAVVEENVPMSKYTSFKTGGNADLLIIPASVDSLSQIIKKCKALNIKPFVMGNGSNLLVTDSGYKGVIIKIGSNLSSMKLLDENTIECVASLDIEDAFEALGMEEVTEDMENDGYDTVGGLIINKLARIPEQGEDACVEHMGVKFSVLEVADRRIVKVKAEKIIEQTEE